MDTPSQRPPHTARTTWLVALLAAVVIGAGAWYALARRAPSSPVVTTNVVANTTTANITSNTNTLVNAANANTNTVVDGSLTYAGDGFSISYPSSWELATITGAAPRLTPKGTTFASEGTPDYPVSLSVTDKTADAYVATLPAGNRSAVTINGRSGYKGFTTFGHEPFYVFTLLDGHRSVIIGYIGDQLAQTSGPTVTTSSLAQVFEQIAQSLQIP